jgi:hypothetical protein
MSRYITRNDDGTIEEEIASMKLCKHLYNDVCCNENCDALGWMVSPTSICEDKYGCGCFEKEDGVIDG